MIADKYRKVAEAELYQRVGFFDTTVLSVADLIEAVEKQKDAREALRTESCVDTAEPDMEDMRAEYFVACRRTENALTALCEKMEEP